jgi:phosphate transport system permease protein
MPDQKNEGPSKAPTDASVRQQAGADGRPQPTTRELLLQRERRLGEKAVEIGIFAISTLSIVFIFLIFLFVFREASPIIANTLGFGEKDSVGATSPGTEAKESPAAEAYNATPEKSAKAPTTPDTSGNLKSDVYNPETGDIPGTAKAPTTPDTAGNLESDVYNPETGDIPGTDTTTAGAAPAAEGPREETLAEQIQRENYPLLTHESPVKASYLLHDNWQPNSDHPRYGIYPIIIGTLKTTIVALLVATPLGILAALFTAFFAPKRWREILKPVIEILAGFPSVVIGYFCLIEIASFMQTIFGIEYRLNAVVAGIGLSLAVIPIIYTITDDALRAVPKSLREAALAVGASEWQAAYQVMLPAATPGIFAAVLLGLGRAFGETMIALMAAGNASTMGWDLFVSVRTFAATIGAEMGEVVFGSPHYQVLFFLGVILFVFSFVINFITEFYVKQRLIKRFRGSA